MTETQQQALEALAGRALTAGEVEQITPLVAAGSTQAIADILNEDRPPRIVSRLITRRGIRALPVLPRHRQALLDTLEAASKAPPAWLAPTLAAVGVPEEDRAALTADLADAWFWLGTTDGLDAGAQGARSMLDVIAEAVSAAAPACAALKATAEVTDPITHTQVGAALQ
jgi:hypothetical protein